MRVLLQRVTAANVSVDRQTIGEIGQGFVLLVGVGHDDTESEADQLAEKIVNLRIFNDDDEKFNRSLLDVEGGALVVSQFTLFADTRKGRRPSFEQAGRPDVAEPLCDYFAARLKSLGVQPVETGRFGAAMHVEIQNDGPVTIWLDSDDLSKSQSR